MTNPNCFCLKKRIKLILNINKIEREIMKIIKSILVAGLISIFATFSTFAEKVKIGDPGLSLIHI